MRFLDFDKVQKDFLAEVLRAEKKSSRPVWFVAYKPEEKRTCLSDGNFAVLIPDDLCYVKAGEAVRVLENAAFLDNNAIRAAEQTELFDRGMRKKIDKIKGNVCILENADFSVWVAEKYINYFSGMSCRYMGKSANNPVMVYYGDQLIGLIMPIRQN